LRNFRSEKQRRGLMMRFYNREGCEGREGEMAAVRFFASSASFAPFAFFVFFASFAVVENLFHNSVVKLIIRFC
jgi:hypothetical protein